MRGLSDVRDFDALVVRAGLLELLRRVAERRRADAGHPLGDADALDELGLAVYAVHGHPEIDAVYPQIGGRDHHVLDDAARVGPFDVLEKALRRGEHDERGRAVERMAAGTVLRGGFVDGLEQLGILDRDELQALEGAAADGCLPAGKEYRVEIGVAYLPVGKAARRVSGLDRVECIHGMTSFVLCLNCYVKIIQLSAPAVNERRGENRLFISVAFSILVMYSKYN